ncbi:hypothetical protein RB594_000267 [Gaeumannomyces avenae]
MASTPVALELPHDTLSDLHNDHLSHLHMSLSRAHTLHGDSPACLTPSQSSMSFSAPHKKQAVQQVDCAVHDALERHVSQQLPPYKPVSQRKLSREARRPRWLRECIAELLGVFFFVFPGLASIASFTIHHSLDKDSASAFGSIFQIGWGMGMGVSFAVITCAPTSGGHFNPAITLCLALWQGFPWRKVPRYIVSQILGAFLAALTILAMYWTHIQDMTARLVAEGKPLVGGGSPASIFAPYPNADQQSMLHVLLIEFFADAFIAVVVWAALDPSNPFVHPASIPFVIGIAYADMIWGFGAVTLSTNLARDLGCRMVAGILFGSEAFTHRNYAPIGILVNIPATLLGTAVYELALRDSLMVIGKGHARHADGEAALFTHMRKAKLLDEEQGIKC